MSTETLRSRAVNTLILFMTGTVIVTAQVHLAAAAQPSFPFHDYEAVLKAYVDDEGMVNYRDLKANRKKLDDFALRVSRLEARMYDNWHENDKIAFWINVYNALTLLAIIGHYPIRSSFLRSFVYPENSIRQIPGVWEKLTFSVMGRNMTLDGIEHDILRARFNEPRIHVALVCAAMGCPPLRNEPYVGAKLDAQLDDQATRFLRDATKFKIDRAHNKVYLSSIFQWFGGDFEKTYSTDKKFLSVSKSEKAVVRFISKYLGPQDRAYLEKGGFSIEYVAYDWSLNEKKQ
jgi:hypothetical protein